MFFSLNRDQVNELRHGGSRPGRQPNVQRDFEDGYRRLYNYYFAENPVYNAKVFRRRFRMCRELFRRIVDEVTNHDAWCEQKIDALGKSGLFTLQKILAAIRMLAYGLSYNMVDEYIRISELAASECLEDFCSAIQSNFGEEYLRCSTVAD